MHVCSVDFHVCEENCFTWLQANFIFGTCLLLNAEPFLGNYEWLNIATSTLNIASIIRLCLLFLVTANIVMVIISATQWAAKKWTCSTKIITNNLRWEEGQINSDVHVQTKYEQKENLKFVFNNLPLSTPILLHVS